MPTLMERSDSYKESRLKSEGIAELWKHRGIWARGHIMPIIMQFFTKGMLQDKFSDLLVMARYTTGIEEQNTKTETWVPGLYGPHNGLDSISPSLCHMTILLNSGALQDYQFMVGVMGDTVNDYWCKSNNKKIEPFSLAFAGRYYFTPNGHDGHIPPVKTVGLPPADANPVSWVIKQIRLHWEYWLEHNMDHPNDVNTKNHCYNGRGNFIFPEKL